MSGASGIAYFLFGNANNVKNNIGVEYSKIHSKLNSYEGKQLCLSQGIDPQQLSDHLKKATQIPEKGDIPVSVYLLESSIKLLKSDSQVVDKDAKTEVRSTTEKDNVEDSTFSPAITPFFATSTSPWSPSPGHAPSLSSNLIAASLSLQTNLNNTQSSFQSQPSSLKVSAGRFKSNNQTIQNNNGNFSPNPGTTFLTNRLNGYNVGGSLPSSKRNQNLPVDQVIVSPTAATEGTVNALKNRSPPASEIGSLSSRLQKR